MSLYERNGASAPFRIIADQIETRCAYEADNEGNIKSALQRNLPSFFDIPGAGIRKTRPLAIVGGGPSLCATLNELRGFSDVMVCGSAHDFLVNEWFRPTYAATCDGSELQPDFFKKRAPNCKYLIASSCHPALFDHMKGRDVYLWHAATALSAEKFAELGIDRTIGCGSMIAITAIPLAILLGYSDLHFFGLDSCRGRWWHSYPLDDEHDTPRDEMIVKVVGDDREYVSSLDYIAQAQQFQEFVQKFGFMFRPTVHGDGLIAAMMRHNKGKSV